VAKEWTRVYGARHLKRAIEKYLVCALANLLASGQVRTGDILRIDWDKHAGQLAVWKESRESEPDHYAAWLVPIKRWQL